MTVPSVPAFEIHVTLLAGESPTPLRAFRQGEPAAPLAVGSAAAFRVSAEGVAPTHLFLAFDGTTLFASASSSSAEVRVGEGLIPRGWTPLEAPCEIRFGAAVLRVAKESMGVPAPIDSATEHTVHDGGALYAAARRAMGHAAAAAAPTPEGIPAFMGTPPTGSPSAPPFAPRELATTPVANPALDAPRAPSVMPPPAAPPPMAPSPSAGVPQLDTPFAALSPTPVPPPETVPRTPSGRPRDPSRDLPTLLTRKAGFWSSASPIKKICVVLMPVVLVVVALGLRQQELEEEQARLEEETARVAATTPSAAPHPSPSPSSSAAELASAASSAAAVPSVTPEPALRDAAASASSLATRKDGGRDSREVRDKDGRTAERVALDTAAAGNFVEAARLYEALAASHPDDPTYKEAARILRERLGRGE